MAKEQRRTQAESNQDSEKFDLNYVHELISRLEAVFSTAEIEPGESLTTTALAEITGMIRRLSGDNSISRIERFHAMQAIQEAAAKEESRLEVKLPPNAPELWKERKNKDENPFAFAHRVYGDAAKFAVISDFHRLDKSLETAMNNFRSRKGPVDSKHYIPSKKELYAGVDSGIRWADIIAAAPPRLRLLLRVYTTKRDSNT